MAVTTVAQLAAQLNRPPNALLEQLQSAGVGKKSPEDSLTEADKERLLEYLRNSHGTAAGAERKKITLTRKGTTEIKQADASGRARTIQVEVRKKRVFVKRDDAPAVDEPTGPSAEELELQRREEQARVEAEAVAGIAVVHGALRIPIPAELEPAYGAYTNRPVILGIRPEDIYDHPMVGGASVEAGVVAVEALGPETILVAAIPGGGEISARLGRAFSARSGSTQRVAIDPRQIHLFDPETTLAVPRTQA